MCVCACIVLAQSSGKLRDRSLEVRRGERKEFDRKLLPGGEEGGGREESKGREGRGDTNEDRKGWRRIRRRKRKRKRRRNRKWKKT